MAYLQEKKRASGWSGPNIDSDGNVEYTAKWTLVATADTYNAWLTFGSAIPAVGQSFEGDVRALCDRVECEQDEENESVWRVTAHYKTPNSEEEQNRDIPPWSRPLRFRWSSVDREVYKFKDLSPTPKYFQDPAGTWMESPPPIPRSHMLLSVQTATRALNLPAMSGFANHVNDRRWYGLPRASCLTKAPEASNAWWQGEHYWELSFQIEVCAHMLGEKWIPTEIVNAGPRYKDGDGNLKLADDDLGNLHGGLQLLDYDGTKLLEAMPPTYTEFQIYRWANFTNLIG